MPFTPFHFGPGLFGKTLVSRHFSWSAFIASQVIIDFETLYFLIQRTYPIHRFFHTFVGAFIAAWTTVVILVLIRNVLHKLEPALAGYIDRLRPSLTSEFSTTGLIIGALAGGLSHPLLDGIMHPDVHPFAPWSDANPFLGVISVEYLHLSCLLLGLIGFILEAMRLRRERTRRGKTWA